MFVSLWICINYCIFLRKEILDAEDIGESEEESEEEDSGPHMSISPAVAREIDLLIAQSKRVVRHGFLTAVHVAKSSYRNEQLCRSYTQRPKQFNVSQDGSVCQMVPHATAQGKQLDGYAIILIIVPATAV